MSAIEELNRRGVIKAAALYVAVAWGGTEIIAFLLDALWSEAVAAPARKFLAILFIAGFPAILYFSWSKDLGLRARRIVTTTVIAVAITALLLWAIPREHQTSVDPERVPGRVEALAVLPLDNLSADPEHAFFAIGVTDALISELSRFEAFTVISRRSVMRFADSDLDIRQIADDLGVDAIVEGSVARDGNRVRISAKLVEASTNHNLWADEFDGEIEDILALQKTAAESIAAGIGATLGESDSRPEPRPVNLEAYDAYLKSVIHFIESNKDPSAAIAEARQIIELDPGFAPGYALLSELYGYLALTAPVSHSEAYLQSRHFARKAMELDPDHPYSRFAMARVYFQFEWAWSDAEREFERGLQLDPNNSNGLSMYGGFRVLIHKDCDGGIEVLESARDRDPFNIGMYFDLGVYTFHCRRHEESLRHMDRVLEMQPDFDWARLIVMGNLAMLGQYEQATRDCRALIEEHEQEFDGTVLAFCAFVFGRSDESALATDVLERLVHPPPGISVDPLMMAVAYLSAGDRERALTALESGFLDRSPNLIFLRVAPGLDPIREEQRFQAIERQMNFPDE